MEQKQVHFWSIFPLGLRREIIYQEFLPGLNPKSLRSVYDVKGYVLLTAIHSSDVNVKPGGSPSVFFKKGRPMSTSGFPFTLSLLIYYNTTLTVSLDTFTHHSAMWLAEVMQELKMVHTSASVRCIAGSNSLSCIKGRH